MHTKTHTLPLGPTKQSASRRLADFDNSPCLENPSHPWTVEMTRRAAQRGKAKAAPAPPVKWHDYYRDPVHDVVLVSSDDLHFRASQFHRNRVR